jgi:hypothetical protein
MNADGHGSEGQAKHTPGPWRLGQGDEQAENRVCDVRGIPVWGPYSAVACGDDACHIVRCVNAFPEMLEALEAVLETESRRTGWLPTSVRVKIEAAFAKARGGAE